MGISNPTKAPDWKELKGDHFIVYFVGKDKFAKKVLKKAENDYKTISRDLGYQRYSGFWMWDNRVKIYVFKTKEDYLEGTGRKEWSHGFASYRSKSIFSYEWNEGFVESLLPHEITHLIFRDYVGFTGEVPRWLDEGVAQWEEPKKRKYVRRVMKSYLKERKWIPVKRLTSMNIRQSDDEDTVRLFYVQSVSLVDFLIKRYGANDFIYFCRQLRDGKSMTEALTFAYPTQIRNLEELEEQWKKYAA